MSAPAVNAPVRRRSVATLLPRVSRRVWRYVTGTKEEQRKPGGGHTDSARYCYTVWLRHLAASAGAMRLDGARIVELGPGRSIGVGLAALLSGAREYYAIDTVDYHDPEKDARILAELVELFRARTPIPDHTEFPDIFPRLSDYRFPASLGDAAHLQPERLARVLAAIRGEASDDVRLIRGSDWADPRIPSSSIDVVLSQAVMLYVTDLDQAYRQMAQWLAPGGVMSHTYNFTSNKLTPVWNGHWACSIPEWDALEGVQPYRVSRLPLSAHLRALEGSGLRVNHTVVEERPGGIGREQLAAEFTSLTDQDLVVARALIQATRKG